MGLLKKIKKGSSTLLKKSIDTSQTLLKKTKNYVNKLILPTNYISSTAQTLLKYASNYIKDIKLFKQPINSLVKNLTNILTNEGLQKQMQDEGINTVYHLGFLMTLDNDVKITNQKNASIEISDEPLTKYKNQEFMNVDLDKEILLIEFQNNTASYMKDKFFTYNVNGNNCQIYAKNSLIANGLYKDKYEKFIIQDITFGGKGGKTMGVLTSIGSVMDRIIK